MTHKFSVITVAWPNLEKMLNDLENLATGGYEVMSILPKDSASVAVVVKFAIKDPEFDEKEIIARL